MHNTVRNLDTDAMMNKTVPYICGTNFSQDNLTRNKMAYILQTTFSDLFLLNGNFSFSNLIGVCFHVSNWQQLANFLDDGWAPLRRQAIIWTKLT